MENLKRHDWVEVPSFGIGEVLFVYPPSPDSWTKGSTATILFKESRGRRLFDLSLAKVRKLTPEEVVRFGLAKPVKIFVSDPDYAVCPPAEPKGLPRKYGRLAGNISGLCPYIFLSFSGDGERHKAPGLFGIPNIGYGLVLPIKRSRDARAREILLALAGDLLNMDQYEVAAARVQAQEKLGELGIKFRTERRVHDDFELERSRELFSLLKQFDYVESIYDQPGGKAVPGSYAPYAWKDYRDFLFWYNSEDSLMSGAVRTPRVDLILETAEATQWEKKYHMIEKPDENAARFFALKASVPNTPVEVTLKMEEYGWALLTVKAGPKSASIACSDVYDPFPDLVLWLKMIHSGDIPAQLRIDEERSHKRLCALATGDSERLLFRIVDAYDPSQLFLEAIVDRAALVEAFRLEVLRFFRNDFVRAQWSGEHSDRSRVKKIMLSDPWLGRF